MPRLAEFTERLARKRGGSLKTLLLDQSFAAGIGNWMADDVLLLARLLPTRSPSSLSPAEIKRLHGSVRDITRIAVAASAQKTDFPRDWLFHIRWKHGTETLTGLAVKHERLAGRATFWIPSLQK